jgi:hypothetical protein
MPTRDGLALMGIAGPWRLVPDTARRDGVRQGKTRPVNMFMVAWPNLTDGGQKPDSAD